MEVTTLVAVLGCWVLLLRIMFTLETISENGKSFVKLINDISEEAKKDAVTVPYPDDDDVWPDSSPTQPRHRNKGKLLEIQE